MTAWQTDVLVSLYVMFWLGNFLANSVAIVLLVKTKQLSNYSYRFLLMLAFWDACIAIFKQPFEIIKTSVLLYIPCSVTLSIHILSKTFPRMSAYTIVLIGIDRYVRIQYPLTFKRILTPFQVSILMIATCALAVFNSIVSFVGNLKNEEVIFRIITLAPDLTLFIISVVLQVKIIFILNRRRGRVTADDNRQSSREIYERAIKLSSRIVKLMVICLTPAAAAATIRSVLAKRLEGSSRMHMEFFVRMVLLGSYVNSIGNAVLFLMMDNPSRTYIRLKLQRITNREP